MSTWSSVKTKSNCSQYRVSFYFLNITAEFSASFLVERGQFRRSILSSIGQTTGFRRFGDVGDQVGRVCVSDKWNVQAIAISVQNSIRDVAPVRALSLNSIVAMKCPYYPGDVLDPILLTILQRTR